MNFRRFSATPTYTITVCDRCQDQATWGAEEGQPCQSEGCGGRLVEIEVVPYLTAQQWRRDHAWAEQKVGKLQAELAGTLRKKSG
ncbi:MAG TPA: hypothetical protein VKG89_00775 [Solirubrobacterales bacterium]|nr:hypothetical protein [Solirubrobacterales bacterium]